MRFHALLALLPFYIIYGSLFTSPGAYAQGTQKIVLSEETDAFINQVLVDFNSPGGVAVAVVRKDDKGAWSVETKGYGVATANGSRVTENTLFAVGSTSKVRKLSSLQWSCSKADRGCLFFCTAFYCICDWALDPQ